MAVPKLDYIIVGQGLAGSILAHRLIARGSTVRVIDNRHHQSASQVAAGIINPITGPRLSLTDKFSQYYPRAKQVYSELGAALNTALWQELEQHRLIQNPSQRDYYQQRLSDTEYQGIVSQPLRSPFFENNYGVISVEKSTVINTQRLIAKSRTWLEQQQSYLAREVAYDQIEVTENGFAVGGEQSTNIIFCEGHQAINNPWLRKLPFKLSKGEILTIETDTPVTHLLNWGNWLAPFGDNAKLGSNYQWDDLSLSPNRKIKQQLLTSLRKHTHYEGKVIHHEVGIRPTTRQRRPFIGPLSNLKGAYCFNGFGSKGCLLIPYHADLLCDHLFAQSPLSRELTQWL